MQRFLLASLAALVCAGTAAAAGKPADKPAPGSMRIESEAQFQRDYGRQATRMAPGVYLMTHTTNPLLSAATIHAAVAAFSAARIARPSSCA